MSATENLIAGELELLAELVKAAGEWRHVAGGDEAELVTLERRGLVLWRRRFPGTVLEGKSTSAGVDAITALKS